MGSSAGEEMNRKEEKRTKRHNRIKMRMQGTALRPRLLVHRTLKNLAAVFIDDTNNKVVFSLSTADKAMRQECSGGGNIMSAETFGAICARKAQEKGVTAIIFDRGGYLYHGRVKSFADALRKGGLKF